MVHCPFVVVSISFSRARPDATGAAVFAGACVIGVGPTACGTSEPGTPAARRRSGPAAGHGSPARRSARWRIRTVGGNPRRSARADPRRGRCRGGNRPRYRGTRGSGQAWRPAGRDRRSTCSTRGRTRGTATGHRSPTSCSMRSSIAPSNRYTCPGRPGNRQTAGAAGVEVEADRRRRRLRADQAALHDRGVQLRGRDRSLKLSTRKPLAPTYDEIGRDRSVERMIGRQPKFAVVEPGTVTATCGRRSLDVVGAHVSRSASHAGVSA